VIRSKAIAFSEVATRAMRTAFPAIAVIAIYYALLLGLLNIMEAMGQRVASVADGVGRVTHVAIWEGPAVIPALLGVFMLILAYELWLRKRAALIVLCGFVITQAFVDRTALGVTVLIAMVLAMSVKEFPGRTDSLAVKRLKVTLPVLAAGFFAYGITGIYLMRHWLGVRDVNIYGLAYRSVAVAVGDSGLNFHGATLAFRSSMTFIAMASIAFVLFLLLRPYREASGRSPEDRKRARALVESYGTDSLAYFNLRSDKSLFFYGEDSFLAYKVVGDVAVISGDPIGPAGDIPAIMESFREYCLERGWRLAVLGASGNLLPYYEEAELRGFSLGEETMVNVESFTLEGRRVRKLRQSVNKLEKAGYTMEFMYNAGIPTHLRHELSRISADWRGGREETGFSMGLGRLFSLEDPDCLLCLAYDEDMRPVGFLHFVPMYPRIGYSLDVHRYQSGSPGALSEFMIAKAAQFLKDEGFHVMSLHFLAFSEHYRDDRETEGNSFFRGLAGAFDRFLPIVSAYNFDKKFYPMWKKRYLLHYGFVDLVLVGLAAIHAESALGITRPSDRKQKAS
jgi:lysyl-tRNA synthetase class 2